MLDIVYDESEDYENIEDNIIDTTRWSVIRELIFKEKSTGKFYRTTYSEGATEMQYEEPWEYQPEVTCAEVKPVKVEVTQYKEIK